MLSNTNNNKKGKSNDPENIVLPKKCVKKSDRIFLHTEGEKDVIADKNDTIVSM